MYVGRGGGAGAALTTVGGITLLPNTGGRSLLTYIAAFAIIGGLTVIVAQIGLAFYKR